MKTHMRATTKVLAIFVLLIWQVALTANVIAVPSSLNVHGRLTDGSGSSLQGNYNMSFRIYTVASGGTALWEFVNMSVGTDSNGVYSAILNTSGLNYSEQYYLSITVQGDAEMAPRINLTSTPYAFRANITESLVEANKYTVRELNVTQNMSVDNDTLFVDSEANRVGIGTVGPNSTLHLKRASAGNLPAMAIDNNIVDAANREALEIWGSGSSKKGLILGYRGDGVNVLYNEIYSADSWQDLRLGIGPASNDLVIDSTGDVGIGTTKPNATLEVNGSFRVTNQSNEALIMYANQSTGYVGIGTASPIAPLQVIGGYIGGTGGLTVTSGTSEYAYVTVNAPSASYDSGVNFQKGGADKWYIYNDGSESDQLRIYDTTGVKVVVEQGGNVGIGAKDPLGRLHVNATGDDNALVVNDTTGNVGIGTKSPSKKLEVNGTAGGITLDPSAATNPVINTTQGNLTITSAGGSVIITLG